MLSQIERKITKISPISIYTYSIKIVNNSNCHLPSARFLLRISGTSYPTGWKSELILGHEIPTGVKSEPILRHNIPNRKKSQPNLRHEISIREKSKPNLNHEISCGVKSELIHGQVFAAWWRQRRAFSRGLSDVQRMADGRWQLVFRAGAPKFYYIYNIYIIYIVIYNINLSFYLSTTVQISNCHLPSARRSTTPLARQDKDPRRCLTRSHILVVWIRHGGTFIKRIDFFSHSDTPSLT